MSIQKIELRDATTGLAYPLFNTAVNPSPPAMPSVWQCTALLHPFSPPPAGTPQQDNPFFQMCLANIIYIEGIIMSVQIKGEYYGNWWYKIYPDLTQVSTDNGINWQTVNLGWSLPSTQWLTASTCVGSCYLNWMEAQMLDWWKTPVPNSNASTWIWMNTAGANNKLPFRMMFGQPPSTPTMGDPAQLALFQMFSFTYLVNWDTTAGTQAHTEWADPFIPGFSFGNNPGYQKFIWNDNFAMTVFMTPVDEKSNPLPTRVFYEWRADNEYAAVTDRAQNTLMWYLYNSQSNLLNEEALLIGACPPSFNPPLPNSGGGFLIDCSQTNTITCSKMPFGCEPPNWAYMSGVNGTIHACISSNDELSPGYPMMLVSVLFPPTTEYPQGRYLWTWYSPTSSSGLEARPVTFMESASNISEGGTSLALADYFSYQEFADWLPPACFEIPAACGATT